MRFAALSAIPINANNPGPLASGHREINWDGGNPNIMDYDSPCHAVQRVPATPAAPVHHTRFRPFAGSPLPWASGGLQGSSTIRTTRPIFSTFSPSRLFTPVGSNVTEALFFVPGTNGAVQATVTGFGAVFTDVDKPGMDWQKKRAQGEHADRVPRCTDSKVLFSSFVPASPGGGICPSSVLSLTTRSSPGPDHKPATLPRARTMMRTRRRHDG